LQEHFGVNHVTLQIELGEFYSMTITTMHRTTDVFSLILSI
jgi:hypothetical protein